MVAIVIIAVGVISIGPGSTPDIDKILETADCDAAGKLTESDLEKIPVEQAMKVSFLIVGCTMGG